MNRELRERGQGENQKKRKRGKKKRKTKKHIKEEIVETGQKDGWTD